MRRIQEMVMETNLTPIEWSLIKPSERPPSMDDEYCRLMINRIMKDTEHRMLGNSEPEKTEK